MLPSFEYSTNVNPQIHKTSHSNQPCFHSFCKEELPPLSPLTAKTMLSLNRNTTPKKLNLSVKYQKINPPFF